MEPNVETHESDAEPLASLTGIVAGVLKCEVSPTDNLFSLGARSMDLVRIISAIDRHYGVRIRALDVFNAPTFSELSALVTAKLESRA